MTNYEAMKILAKEFGPKHIGNDFSEQQIYDFFSMRYQENARMLNNLVSFNFLDPIHYDIVDPVSGKQLVGYRITEEGYDFIHQYENDLAAVRKSKLESRISLLISLGATIISLFALFK